MTTPFNTLRKAIQKHLWQTDVSQLLQYLTIYHMRGAWDRDGGVITNAVTNSNNFLFTQQMDGCIDKVNYFPMQLK